jgi:hypothetical protein
MEWSPIVTGALGLSLEMSPGCHVACVETYARKLLYRVVGGKGKQLLASLPLQN